MFRIRLEFNHGYVVEERQKTWWGKTYWIPYLWVLKHPHQAWCFSSYGDAMSQLLNKIEDDTNKNVETL
jgi:hypothetical protein